MSARDSAQREAQEAYAMQPSRDIRRLVEIMAALRDPLAGCPWDVEQTFASIVPFTIEEAYEVADAVERGSPEDLREELGDLLLQVVFHARMAEEAGLFDFGGVVEAITASSSAATRMCSATPAP
jgi:ATP diphosphatase